MTCYDGFFFELFEMNKKWFEANKHLTNQEMLDAGLIDEQDLAWINKFRAGKDILVGDMTGG
jgi:hypothetical protein